jgi:prepilin-type N-terminal cleavage/methylation domain-containing protein
LPFFALRITRNLVVLALKSIGLMVKPWARGLLLLNNAMVGCAKSGEKGFTLVELLVVVAIVGILSSIAITQYAFYKEKAVDSKMEATLHAGRQAMEGYYVENNTYEFADLAALQNSHGFKPSQNVALSITPPPTATNYSLCAYSSGGTAPAFFYSTTGGSMVADNGTNCP